MDGIVFYIAGALAVAASLLVVTRKNPVHSAAFLLSFLLAVSLQFLTLRAPFLAVVQVLLGAGSIVVLFLVALMLLDPLPGGVERGVAPLRRVFAGLGAALLFALLATAIRRSSRVRETPGLDGAVAASEARAGEAAAVGRSLLGEHILTFELTSIVILIAIIGAVYLTRVERGNGARPSSREDPA